MKKLFRPDLFMTIIVSVLTITTSSQASILTTLSCYDSTTSSEPTPSRTSVTQESDGWYFNSADGGKAKLTPVNGSASGEQRYTVNTEMGKAIIGVYWNDTSKEKFALIFYPNLQGSVACGVGY